MGRSPDLNEIVVFANVVSAGSFAAAARSLDIPRSTVSRKVADLEERLGARLLQRTTRKLSLTDVGRAYYRHAERVVAEVEEAELSITRLQDVPRGLLRITAPLNFDHLGPLVAAFLSLYPEVQIKMICTDRTVDLIQEGCDVAIRAGRLADSALIARRLGTLESFVVASPAFLEAGGAPAIPADLAHFDCLVFGAGTERSAWRLSRAGEEIQVSVRVRYMVNDFEMLRAAAVAGLGISIVPAHLAASDLREGRLIRVLQGWSSRDAPIHAVYPSSRHLSPTLRAFLEHLERAMNPPPWQL